MSSANRINNNNRQVNEEACPLCLSEAFLNPNMRFQHAICGHKFCESCINRNFLSGNTIECPICGTVLRKANFMAKQDVDPEVEKEINIRKSILKDFNKRREDFATLRAFNDYLEEVEDLIFNLINNIDVEATQLKIRNYKKANSAQIVLNQSKQVAEIQELQTRLLAEEAEAEGKRRQRLIEQQRQLEQQKKEREEMIENLAAGRLTVNASKTSADLKKPSAKHKTLTNILMETAKPVNKPPAFTPYTPGVPPVLAPILPQPQVQQAAVTAPPPQPPQNLLPQPMEVTSTPQPAQNLTPEEQEKLRQAQAKAGGWKDDYVRRRALEEAMAGLAF